MAYASRRDRARRGWGPSWVTTLCASVLLVVGLTGCGDDDGESAQERYCEAGSELESSVGDLVNLDLIADGTSGLESAIQAVEDDLTVLDDTASEAAADEVDALEQAASDLESALAGFEGGINADNVSELARAVGDVGTSAQAVYATLSDCP